MRKLSSNACLSASGCSTRSSCTAPPAVVFTGRVRTGSACALSWRRRSGCRRASFPRRDREALTLVDADIGEACTPQCTHDALLGLESLVTAGPERHGELLSEDVQARAGSHD